MLRKHGPRLQCKPALAVWRQSVGYLHLEAIVCGDTAMYDVEAGQSRYSGHWQKIFNNKTEDGHILLFILIYYCINVIFYLFRINRHFMEEI